MPRSFSRAGLSVLLMLLAAGCLEFWHKDVGIIPEAIKRDKDAQRQVLRQELRRPAQGQAKDNPCAAGESWSTIADCKAVGDGGLECFPGCVKVY